MSLKSFIIASIFIHVVGAVLIYFYYNPIQFEPRLVEDKKQEEMIDETETQNEAESQTQLKSQTTYPPSQNLRKKRVKPKVLSSRIKKTLKPSKSKNKIKSHNKDLTEKELSQQDSFRKQEPDLEVQSDPKGQFDLRDKDLIEKEGMEPEELREEVQSAPKAQFDLRDKDLIEKEGMEPEELREEVQSAPEGQLDLRDKDLIEKEEMEPEELKEEVQSASEGQLNLSDKDLIEKEEMEPEELRGEELVDRKEDQQEASGEKENKLQEEQEDSSIEEVMETGLEIKDQDELEEADKEEIENKPLEKQKLSENINSQNTENQKKDSQNSLQPAPSKKEIDFYQLKQKPGNPSLSYPDFARRAGMQGRLVVQFFVDENGFVDQIQLKRSSGHSKLDNFVLRLISLYQFKTKKVWAKFDQTFKLEGEEKDFSRLNQRTRRE